MTSADGWRPVESQQSLAHEEFSVIQEGGMRSTFERGSTIVRSRWRAFDELVCLRLAQ